MQSKFTRGLLLLLCLLEGNVEIIILPRINEKPCQYGQGKTGASETMLHVGGTRQEVPACMPYMPIYGRGKGGFQ